MGKGGKVRKRHLGGSGSTGQGRRVSDKYQWEPEKHYRDADRDLRDLYDEPQDAVNDEYIWPEFESEDDD
ncbi:MAG: hypothetical protein A4E35_01922 [Methanoregula sp. PtaU1.Bin051]|nr:MAG: hypothetical protein A4E35_01922 [Methanoregula sp. PtaU1.Bin051]